jgi:gamma-glutamylcyclotransferase (GGCT)/AIG2-like uncharacterized protein YtfP
MPLVFQYGSNCDLQRLNGPTRLKGGARDLGLAQTVDRYKFAFNKHSQRSGAAADLVKAARTGRRVWGVLYEMSQQALRRLDEIEGPSYRRQRVAIVGQAQKAWTFRVRRASRRKNLATTSEYIGHIVGGLRAHGASEEYVDHVISVALETNQEATRPDAAENRAIAALRRTPSA